MSAEKPFDFAVTPGKLPKQVVPTEYSVRVVPNIDKNIDKVIVVVILISLLPILIKIAREKLKR